MLACLRLHRQAVQPSGVVFARRGTLADLFALHSPDNPAGRFNLRELIFPAELALRPVERSGTLNSVGVFSADHPGGTPRAGNQPAAMTATTATRTFIMQQIPLSKNQVAIVDDEDFERLSGFRWFFRGERNGRQGYAIRHRKDGKTTKTQYLHREVVGPVQPKHEVIFRNGDKLDCRKENLRVATIAEARQHHKNARSNSDSSIKGITFNHRARTYSVDIWRDGRAKRVGTFNTLTEAQERYRNASCWKTRTCTRPRRGWFGLAWRGRNSGKTRTWSRPINAPESAGTTPP